MSEPTAKRDVGPFTDSAQTRAQYDAQMYGVPAALSRSGQGPLMVLAEATLLAGLELTDHEQAVLAAANLSQEAAVILAGLIIRARTRQQPVTLTGEQLAQLVIGEPVPLPGVLLRSPPPQPRPMGGNHPAEPGIDTSGWPAEAAAQLRTIDAELARLTAAGAEPAALRELRTDRTILVQDMLFGREPQDDEPAPDHAAG